MNFLIAIVASATIVLASPFMGQLQSFLRRSLSTDNYVLLFGGGVLVAVALAGVVAFIRIRDRRAQRFTLLLAALACGGAYMWATATPYPEVNAVERVHFVEYGLIAVLFYRANWSRHGSVDHHPSDPAIIVWPLLAAFLVGTLDEWLQWFIPVRVGEAKDVALNLVSIACGLMFALALQPPVSWSMRLAPASARRIGVFAAIVWVVFAAFVSQVHLGHVIDEPAIGRFRSHYTATGLDALQIDRAAKWKHDPPLTLRRLSREDQYLDEGLWHVRRRNLTDAAEAWRENLILERYYAPVLDTSTYASPKGNRWPAEQRADMAARAAVVATSFSSAAAPYPIVDWPKPIFWPIAIVVALILAVLPRLATTRR